MSNCRDNDDLVHTDMLDAARAYKEDQYTIIDDNMIESEENENYMDTLCFDDMIKIKQWFKDSTHSNNNGVTMIPRKLMTKDDKLPAHDASMLTQ